MIPEGARCALHPEDDAIDVCARCGDFLCKRCGIELDGKRWCKKCEEHAGDPFPWERRREIGYLRAFGRTIRASIFAEPMIARGFRDRSVLPALVFCILVSVPITWAMAIITVTGTAPDPSPDVHPAIAWLDSDAGLIVVAALAPLRILFEVCLLAFAWWVGLRTVGAVQRPFDQILRTIAYTYGSTAPLDLFGLVGPPEGTIGLLVSLVFRLVIQGRALSVLMRADTGRVVIAALLMVAVLFAVFCVLAIVVGSVVVFGLEM